jgi:choline dehydrogenase
MKADYVIVGAGSAGCVLANRLTEDPSVRVILVEAGGKDWNPLIHVPAGFFKMLDHDTLTWKFRSEPDPGTDGRSIVYTRGRVVGGSSSINGLIYIRGQPEDYDHWGQLGNRGWSWDDCLPYFRKAERWEGEETEVRGKDGPLFTSKIDRSPICASVVEAGKELGLEYREDVNSITPGAGECIGWCQQTRGGRRRASAARTYLRPALKRPNLQVVVKALVNRIVFDGRRAVAVDYERGGAVERADAEREVILSAGAVNSPHILQLSGIGAPEHLSRVGIPVHHALPGVGQNLQDHYIARISYPVVGMSTINERSHGMALVTEMLRYLVTGKGMLTYSASLAAASVKVLEESATPDVQCSIAPGSFKDGQIGELEPRLRRGQIGRPETGAGDQPALSERSDRSPRDRRRPQIRAAALCRPVAGQICRRRDPARQPCRDRRRVARLCPRKGLDRLSRDLQLQDGQRPDGGRRRPAARPRPRTAARHRRLGDADGYLDQHQRSDDHDRRKGRRPDPRHRAGGPTYGEREGCLTLARLGQRGRADADV